MMNLLRQAGSDLTGDPFLAAAGVEVYIGGHGNDADTVR
jgi:hypothetical protein